MELATCRGSNLSSEGLVGDRIFLVIVVLFNIMKGPSAVALSTGGSAATWVASGTLRAVGSACPLALSGRGTRSVMSADVVAVRPKEYVTGDGKSALSSGVYASLSGVSASSLQPLFGPQRIWEWETSPEFGDVLHLPMGQCPRERENLFSGRIPSMLCGLRARQCPRRANGSGVKDSRVGFRRWPVHMCLQ